MAATAVTVLLWASSFAAIRSAGHHFGPGALALGRLLAGSAASAMIRPAVALRAKTREAAPARSLPVALIIPPAPFIPPDPPGSFISLLPALSQGNVSGLS
jgi:hypothetical protein